jgi:hypothetical protein
MILYIQPEKLTKQLIYALRLQQTGHNLEEPNDDPTGSKHVLIH